MLCVKLKNMTPQERLKLYETALIDWNLIPIMGQEEREGRYLHHGFCAYFNNVHDVYVYDDDRPLFKIKLPELFAQAPKKYSMYWFEFEDTKSRITCLENAIKLTKEKYKL